MATHTVPWMHAGLHLGWLAAVIFALALWWLGADHTGFDAARHPVGHLGAVQAPLGWRWNTLGFVLPGLFLFGFSLALESAMRSEGCGRAGRIGTGLLMISALAFAAQGVWHFDLDDELARGTQAHVSALALALLALLAGASFVAASIRRLPRWRMLTVLGQVLAALLLVTLVWPPQEVFEVFHARPGHAQRLILALYFAWFLLASRVALAAIKPSR